MPHSRVKPERRSPPHRRGATRRIALSLLAGACLLAVPAFAGETDRPVGWSAHPAYSAPAYLVAGMRPPAIYRAPYEPWIDGGSVVGAPPFQPTVAFRPIPTSPPVLPKADPRHHLRGLFGW